MRWDRFFEDLEDQLDSEWEAERAALDSEAERLRVSRIPLRERLVALSAGSTRVSIELIGAAVRAGRLVAVGGDWVALGDEDGPGFAVVPVAAIVAIGLEHADVIASARSSGPGPALRGRMGFGFVMRDFARKRVPVAIDAVTGRTYAGTIDRAGADHLDIALHDIGAPRRTDSIRGHRLLSFDGVAAVRPQAPVTVP